MELVEQRIKLQSGKKRAKRLVSERDTETSGGGDGRAHGVDDVLPLGSIPDVHGIVSNWHHMYGTSAGREREDSLSVSTDNRPKGRR
jgi:hypothetical protein